MKFISIPVSIYETCYDSSNLFTLGIPVESILRIEGDCLESSFEDGDNLLKSCIVCKSETSNNIFFSTLTVEEIVKMINDL